MKVKTTDLSLPALDWAVAQCEMMQEDCRDRGLLVHRIGYGHSMPPYSTDWSQGGPLIEREWIELDAYRGQWRAVFHGEEGSIFRVGPTPLIAAMRCFVTSCLGYEIEIPEELLK